MKSHLKVFAFLLVTWFGLPPSHAALLMVRNDVANTLSFANPNDFSGAQFHQRQSISQTAGAAGETGAFTFTFGQPTLNFAVTGDSHIAISGLSVLPGTATFTRTSIDGQPGKFAIDFDRVANTGVTLTTTVSGGFNVLEHTLNSSTTLVAGSPFTFEIVIPGDWSVAGAASGNHQLININPLWTIDQDFVFSGGATKFSAHIDNFINDSTRSAQVDFRLIGAAVSAVPEPAGWMLLALGLAGLGFSRRKQTQ